MSASDDRRDLVVSACAATASCPEFDSTDIYQMQNEPELELMYKSESSNPVLLLIDKVRQHILARAGHVCSETLLPYPIVKKKDSFKSFT